MLKLSSPWVTYYNEIKALFGEDPDIRVEYDEDENEVKLFVEDQEKADALSQLLPPAKAFGNVVMKITVIPANRLKESQSVLFEKAFKGNPAFSYMASAESIYCNPITYVVFKNKVVQFWNDNLGDINGNMSTLYQNIASDILGETTNVFFCTDTAKGDEK